MAGLKSLIGLAFLGSIGITLLILACALDGLWWPFFCLIFYFLAPIPTLLAQRQNNNDFMDVAIFITMGFVVSAFALPIILARAPGNVNGSVIAMRACYLSLSGNAVIFITLLGFFMVFQQDDSYGMW